MGEGNFVCPTLIFLNTGNLQTLKHLSFQMLGLDGSLVFLVNFFLSVFNLMYFAFVLRHCFIV